MRKFDILVFNWRCWMNPDMGGAEVFTHEVLKRLAAMGHSVTLFTSEFKNGAKKESLDGIEIVRSGGKYSVYRNARKYYSTSSSREYDVVIDEINTRPFMTPKFVHKGERIIALIHQLAREYWFYETPFPVSYAGYHILENMWLKNYKDIPTITVSESTRTDLVKLGFQKIFTVTEGLNFKPLENLAEKNPQPIIVYAGRLKKAKRPDHAIAAFKTLRKTFGNAEFWIIGEGPLKEDLKRRACEGVRFFDVTSNHQRRDLIKQAWILVNPSVREGFGLNVVEANALGVPCVAYDVPGLRDSIINQKTGLLAKPGNTIDLAELMIDVLKNEKLRTKLSNSALVFSRMFSWDKTAQEFIAILNSSVDSSAEFD